MKGLFYKDITSIWLIYRKNILFFLAIVAVFAFIFGAQNSSMGFFLTFMPVFLSGNYVIGSLRFDETSQFLSYVRTLPVRPVQIVAGKYLLGLLFLTGSLSVTALIILAVGALTGSLPAAAMFLPVLATAFLMGLCYLAVVLPLSYRFGTSRASTAAVIALLLIWFSCFAAVSLLGRSPLRPHFVSSLNETLSRLAQQPLPLCLLLAAAALVLYGVSFLICLPVYQKQAKQ